jgi:hypothetical protein
VWRRAIALQITPAYPARPLWNGGLVGHVNRNHASHCTQCRARMSACPVPLLQCRPSYQRLSMSQSLRQWGVIHRLVLAFMTSCALHPAGASYGGLLKIQILTMRCMVVMILLSHYLFSRISSSLGRCIFIFMCYTFRHVAIRPITLPIRNTYTLTA